MRSFTVRGSESPGSKASVVRSSREGAEPIDEIVESGRSPLDSIVRDGARRMLQAALESEVDAFLEEHAVLLAKYDEWSRRDITGKQYVYVWADGIHVRIRLEDPANPRQCLLVVMGATADDQKELIAVIDGVRESKQSWLELLLDLKNRGLTIPPTIAVADGALGFWAALREAYPTTREQRCWVHKTANVINSMPTAIQPKAKFDLHQIWLAETREMANKAFDHFLAKYGAKYEASCASLAKDRDVLLAFYDFPAEHWSHLRTTNPIESTFATIRLRHRRTKGSGSRKASLAMMYKLAESAARRWRRLNASHQLTLVIQGRIFTDGVLQNAA